MVEKKTIVGTLGINCEEVNIKLNKIEKQLDRIIEKQELIRSMKIGDGLGLYEKYSIQPKHNNMTINMNRSIDADAVAEHIAKSIKLALSNI